MTRTLVRLRAAMRRTSVKVGVVGALAVCAATTLATAPSAGAATLPASPAVPAGYSTTLAGAQAAAVKAPITESQDSSSFCSGTYYFDYSETQIDNCPGNGAASWAWVYAPRSGNVVTGSLVKSYISITFVNGSTGSVSANAPGTNTGNWYGSGKRIGGFNLCEQLITLNGLIVYRCSEQVTVPA